MKKLILILAFFFGAIQYSTASSQVGTEVSYKQIYSDSTVFEITFKVYRYCNGLAISDITSSTSVHCAGSGASTSLTPTLVSIRELTSFSGTAKECDPPNTTGTGQGLEELVFKDTIDFSQSPFSNYYTCSEVIIAYGTCCRGSFYTTGVANSNIYNSASFFPTKFPNNNSTHAETVPLFQVPAQVGVRYAHKQYNNDNDSLSFELINPKTNATSSVTYSTGYYADQPLNVFYYGSFSYPISFPQLDPPVGFYFDEKTGDMAFTSTNQNDITSYMVKVTEWQKDSSGTMAKAGVTHRETGLAVYSIGHNNLPEIQNTNNSYTSCIGETNTINLEAIDQITVPPPPATAVPDTLGFRILCDYPVQLSIDTQLYGTSKTELFGKLTWNTDSFDTVPNSFDVYVYAYETNSKAAFSYNVRRFTIHNYERPDLSTTVNKIGCGKYSVTAQLDTFRGISSIVSYNVTDTGGYAVHNGFISAFQPSDTFKLRDSGTFYITTTSSYALACETVVFDTIEISANEAFGLPLETEFLACYTNEQELEVDAKWATTDWNTGDTTNKITVSSGGTYNVNLADQCGDTTSASFFVEFREYAPQLRDTALCKGESTSVTINPPSQVSWIWPDGSTGLKYTTSDSGVHSLSVYDSLCSYAFSEDFYIERKFDPSVNITNLNDQICEDSTFILTATGANVTDIQWSNGGQNLDSTTITQAGTYTIEVLNECGSDRDTIEIYLKLRPDIAFGGDTIICTGDSTTLSTRYNSEYDYFWSNGTTDSFTSIKTEAFHRVDVSNVCGTTSDSIYVYVLDSPKVDLGPDTMINQFDVIKVANRTPSRFATYLWNFGSNSDSAEIRLEGTYWLEETNVCGTAVDSITVKYTGNVAEVVRAGYKIYPSPATHKITVESESGKPFELHIISLNGEIVSTHSLVGKSSTVNVSSLARGMYWIRLVHEDRILAQPLLLN